MAIQPKFHWQFKDKSGATTVDSINNVQARLSDARPDNENQVGELASGEVALYQHAAYHGRTWILSDTEKDRSGEYPNLSAFQSLQDETSSIRLGPETGMTVFREDKFRGSLEGKPVRQFDRARRLEGRQSKAFRNIREKVKEAAEKAQEAAKASLAEDIACAGCIRYRRVAWPVVTYSVQPKNCTSAKRPRLYYPERSKSVR